MNVADADLVRILEERDGPLGSAWRPHLTDDGRCRYGDLYPEGECPWCIAERARIAAGLAPSPQRGA
jgi:hypothetical protein